MGTRQGISAARIAEGLSAVDQERWQHIDRLFEAVLERPAAERNSFLETECSDDPGLRAELDSLVAAHDQEDGFLERPGRLEAGATVGNYRIIRGLGSGGSSEVYLAQDTRLARPAAIKVLSSHWTADREQLRRFRREALAASALNHPNVVTVYEIGESSGHEFIASEFVEGATLREYIRAGSVPIAWAIETTRQIAAALTAAHQAGIIHRDIKPENVIVRSDGLVKVLDFGIAKQARTQEAGDPTSTTATGVVVGTAAYMSPEQARGQAVDARTDIWSLGVVLYEIIAGRLPFPGATATDRIAAILERRPEPLTALRHHVPAGLERIIFRALAKDRDKRYADAAAFAEDLRKLQRESGAKRFFRQIVAGRRAPVLAAVLAIVAVAAAITSGWLHSTRQAPPTAIQSLAVAPFVNAGGTRDVQYLCDGISDTLINDLSEIRELKVMSGNSVSRYKGAEIDTQKIAERLRVGAVLTGRVSQHADDVAVNVELVDARDNSHMWGEQYRRKLANIADIQEEIAHDVTDQLRLRLSQEEKERLARRRTSNTEAYQSYLKGRYYWFKRAYPSWLPATAPDFGKSREYYERAIEADPGYALAYAGLGHYYAMAAGNALMRPGDGWPKAEAAFKKALELDPSTADAWTGIAIVKWVDHRDWRGGEDELRRAIGLSPPSRPEPLFARLLAAEGRFNEAIAQIRRAVDLDPLSIRYSSGLGLIYYYARRYDDSINQYRQTLEIDPNDVWVHEALAGAYERKGRLQEAAAEIHASLTLAGERDTAALLDRANARLGFTAAARVLARKRLDRFAELTQRGEFVPALEQARAYLSLGEREQALRWLAKACEEHTVAVMFLKVDPLYDDLRADPRFQEIAACIRAPK